MELEDKIIEDIDFYGTKAKLYITPADGFRLESTCTLLKDETIGTWDTSVGYGECTGWINNIEQLKALLPYLSNFVGKKITIEIEEEEQLEDCDRYYYEIYIEDAYFTADGIMLGPDRKPINDAHRDSFEKTCIALSSFIYGMSL